ncbi:MAG: transposase [Bacteroidota bacterium]
MIRKKISQQQTSFWVATDDLQVKPQITFFSKLNKVLEGMKFGQQVRKLCEPYYSDKTNCRPPIDPEIYFKMLMVGFFENLRSERGISSRCADSLSIREFLGYSIIESTPEHSSLSVIRQRLPLSVYSQIFSIALKELKNHGLVKGKNLAFDTSVMEANASLSGLQSRMTEESYAEYIAELAKQSGVNPEDKAAVARFDRKREGRKTSNKEWYNPFDSDAKIGKTKAGATDMLYKPEHVVDLDTGAIVDADILLGDCPDTEDLTDRLIEAQIRLLDISDNPIEEEAIETATADKGYYNVSEITEIQCLGITTVISDKEINRNTNKLSDEGATAVELAQSAVKSNKGKELLKRRGMHVERSFAHVLDCGGERRTTLRGINKNRKRYLIATATYNLSLLMRTIFGIGTLKQWVANSIFAFILVLKSIYSLPKRFFVIFRTIFSIQFFNADILNLSYKINDF